MAIHRKYLFFLIHKVKILKVIFRLAITKLDILDQLSEIKIAISYSYKGVKLDSFPGKK